MKYLDRVGNIIDKGDIIYCVDISGAIGELTVGKTYTIIDVTEELDMFLISIINDYNKNSWYVTNRFKKDMIFYRNDVINNILE